MNTVSLILGWAVVIAVHVTLAAVTVLSTSYLIRGAAGGIRRRRARRRAAAAEPPLPFPIPVWTVTEDGDILEMTRTVDDWRIVKWSARPDGGWSRSTGRYQGGTEAVRQFQRIFRTDEQ